MTHAQKRALERYGILLRDSDFKEMKRQIVEGEAIKIRRVSKNIAVYTCKLKTIDLLVVYNRSKKFFITALPNLEGHDDKR